jgi:hypothetical protein
MLTWLPPWTLDVAATMEADVAAQLQAHFVISLAHVTQNIAISAQ